MKNRLFASLASIMLVIFLLTFLLSVYLFNISIKQHFIFILTLWVIMLVFIPLFANIMAHHIIESSLSSVSAFLAYITDVLLNDHYDVSKIDDQMEDEVLNYLVTYGHNSKDVKEALKRVKYAQTLRQEFSANVSHELKTPLTSINGYAEMIAGGMTNLDEARHFSRIINEQGKRLLRMIDETIQLSQFDNNYVASERFTNFNIKEVIDSIFEEIVIPQKNAKIEISTDIDQVYFYGSKKLIGDLVRNLLSNAIKYSKPEGGCIKLQLKETLADIRIIVEDDGIGIAKEEQERIFERFYVVNKSRGNKGTGLGLSLVKNIARVHQGHVRLDSSLGEGSTFTVILPKLIASDYR